MVALYSVFALIKLKNFSFGTLYLKAWRFINFCIVGGIGVLINYAVFLVTLPFMPWFLSNILAILAATLWNYLNDVGAWAKHWGFNIKGTGKNNEQT